MLVDIDLERSEMLLVHQRGDGTSTVSVPVSAFQRAVQILSGAQADAVIRLAPQSPDVKVH